MADNNPFPGENNTGHVWDDDLRELKNPPPRWWMISFWISVLFWIAYSIIYPMWPSFTSDKGSTKGVTGWTMMKEYKEGLAEVEAVRAQFEDKINAMSAAEILNDEGLSAYTEASARVLFGDYCAACHGRGGQGGPEFPVLADDDWLYGGTVETIEQAMLMGRKGVMIAHGNTLSSDEIDGLANAIIAGNPTSDPNFMQKGCIACHGIDGKGVQALGGANLTDAIWRFAEDDQLASVKYTIKHGVNDPNDKNTRQAEMPKFSERLSRDEIKKLAVYVHRLGGGQ